MKSRVYTHFTQAVLLLVTVISTQLSGCGGGSDETGKSLLANGVSTSAATTTTSLSASATNSALPIFTDSSAYSLISRNGDIYDPTVLNPDNLSHSSGSYGTGSQPELEGADMSSLTADSSQTTTAARVGQESVIGFDSRVQVNAQTYPYRATARITYNGLSHCTGWLVSSDTLVTAGHCVHGGGPQGHWGNTAAFRVFPGYSDGFAPYGSCTARELYTSNGWIQEGNDDADIGIIKLNCTIGNSTGYLSYFVANPVENVYITVNGYPSDRANGTQQWASDGRVNFATNKKLYYDNDTNGGMSGAPLWVYGSGNSIWSIGLHTNGENAFSPGNNSGTRISQEIFDLITAVKNIR